MNDDEFHDQIKWAARLEHVREVSLLGTADLSYLSHYHRERNHQGLENKIINPGVEVGQIAGNIVCRERLGGTLRYYDRDAA